VSSSISLWYDIESYFQRRVQKMAFSLKLRPASGELLNLDFLRFMASTGIVAHHSIEYFIPREYREAVTDQTRGLSLFVDLFFVISGFVIAYVYHGKVGTFAGYGNFVQRRVGRLFPLHLLTLAVSIVVLGAVAALGQAANHLPSFAPRCIAQTAVFLHAIISCGNGMSFNGVSWSIGAEMVMYLLFPVFAWAGHRAKNSLSVTTLAVLLAAVAVHRVESTAWETLWPAFRALPSFLIGVSLFYWRDALRRIPKAGFILAASLPIMVVAMTTGMPDILTLALVYVVVASAIAADVQGSVAAAVKRFGPLGQLTYSLYMWHSILITIFLNAIGDKLLHAGTGLMLVIGAACYASIFVISCLSYVFVETPARRWIDGFKLFSTTDRGPGARVSAISHRSAGGNGEALTTRENHNAMLGRTQ
jgi:peptidoglycan/LPS O-acetylase OafA/YrhL